MELLKVPPLAADEGYMADEIWNTRRHPRLLCSSVLEVICPDTGDRLASIFGVVEDVSEQGVCMSLDSEFEPGSTVLLHGIEHTVSATVRHCTLDEEGFFHVGFEFAPDHEWSYNGTWPEHVTRTEFTPIE